MRTGPFTEVVTANLNLRNPSNNPVIFKVKTTAPKQYCVRPNSGLLQPSAAADIAGMCLCLSGRCMCVGKWVGG